MIITRKETSEDFIFSTKIEKYEISYEGILLETTHKLTIHIQYNENKIIGITLLNTWSKTNTNWILFYGLPKNNFYAKPPKIEDVFERNVYKWFMRKKKLERITK